MKKKTRSNAVDAQQERDRDKMTLQRTPTGICASAIDLPYQCMNTAIMYVTSARQRSSRDAVGDLTVLPW